MEIAIHQSGKKKPGKVKVSDQVFATEYNEPLVHQVVTAYMAGGRAGSRAQKTRSEVRGGGRKPWRQKGLGRARAGSIRSPLWRGGGVTFAAKPRDHSQKVNRKMYRGAMRSILSELVRQDRLTCIDKLEIAEPKTSIAKKTLTELGLSSVLIVADEMSQNTFLALRNLPRVDVIDASELNPYSLLGFEQVLLTKPALEKIEAWLT